MVPQQRWECMRQTRQPGTKHYRLTIDHGRQVEPAILEFEADGREGIFFAADRAGRGREVSVIEDGRPLARVRSATGTGYWVINPPMLTPTGG